jgi:hypothetical protein
MASYIDINGDTQQVTLDASIYRQASAEGLTVEQHLNRIHPTKAGDLSAFKQMCASEGMILGSDKEYGIRPSTMDAILNGHGLSAATIVRDAIPTSRIIFPAFTMSAIEDKLRNNDYGVVAQYNSMAASVDTIANDRFERPILNFDKPEAARSKAISQNAEPNTMLSITVSDKSWRITGKSIGLTISDQAIRNTPLDLVTLAMTRQYETEMVEEVEDSLLAFRNGDVDIDMAALSTVSGAVTKANALDTTIITAGALTQKAWVKWLFANNRQRTIRYVITDIDGAMAIENRTGRPTVQGDNATSPRIDTGMSIVNPAWPEQVRVFISQDPNWPADTILGFDNNYGFAVVNSSMLAYEAAESYAMRRSQSFRMDRGSVSYRLFDAAWAELSLTT